MKMACLILGLLVAVPTAVGAESKRAVSGPAAQFAAQVAHTMDITLTDYPSARFRDVKFTIFDDGSGGIACGFVNSKNRSGGYAGWIPFLVIGAGKDKAVPLIGDTEAESAAVLETCADPKQKWLAKDFSKEVSAANK